VGWLKRLANQVGWRPGRSEVPSPSPSPSPQP
jgi:hypothetical protein